MDRIERYGRCCSSFFGTEGKVIEITTVYDGRLLGEADFKSLTLLSVDPFLADEAGMHAVTAFNEDVHFDQITSFEGRCADASSPHNALTFVVNDTPQRPSKTWGVRQEKLI